MSNSSYYQSFRDKNNTESNLSETRHIFTYTHQFKSWRNDSFCWGSWSFLNEKFGDNYLLKCLYFTPYHENAWLLKATGQPYSHFPIKVAEHSFGSFWLYVICQIMAREGLQLTSWNLASGNYIDERFWLTGKIWHFCSFHGNMNDWIQL